MFNELGRFPVDSPHPKFTKRWRVGEGMLVNNYAWLQRKGPITPEGTLTITVFDLQTPKPSYQETLRVDWGYSLASAPDIKLVIFRSNSRGSLKIGVRAPNNVSVLSEQEYIEICNIFK